MKRLNLRRGKMRSAADAAYFEISAALIEKTKEIEAGIIADYDVDGHIVGIEVLSASQRGLPRVVD